MLAFLVSVGLVAYLLVPGAVFRAVFTLFVPLKAFDRTRTQELAYSVVVCALPFLLALVAVWATPLGHWPFSFPDTWALRDADLETILLACFSDRFGGSADAVWDASIRTCHRQGRLLAWYVGFTALEGLGLGLLAAHWGRLQPRLAAKSRRLEALVTRLVLANVSEWHVLLTPCLFPGTRIHVDAMTSDDQLYRGEVLSYTRGRDGLLTGLYLDKAERFDRVSLLKDREAQLRRANGEYWRAIVGKRLFIFADRLSTLNIRAETTLERAEALAESLDLREKITVSVSTPEADVEDAPASAPA